MLKAGQMLLPILSSILKSLILDNILFTCKHMCVCKYMQIQTFSVGFGISSVLNFPGDIISHHNQSILFFCHDHLISCLAPGDTLVWRGWLGQSCIVFWTHTFYKLPHSRSPPVRLYLLLHTF